LFAANEEEEEEEEAPSDDDGEEDVVPVAITYSRKDPISQSNIREPVKNRICGHAYDRASIAQFIQQQAQAGRPARFRRPVFSSAFYGLIADARMPAVRTRMLSAYKTFSPSPNSSLSSSDRLTVFLCAGPIVLCFNFFLISKNVSFMSSSINDCKYARRSAKFAKRIDCLRTNRSGTNRAEWYCFKIPTTP
jgi:hypothetical protein